MYTFNHSLSLIRDSMFTRKPGEFHSMINNLRKGTWLGPHHMIPFCFRKKL